MTTPTQASLRLDRLELLAVAFGIALVALAAVMALIVRQRTRGRVVIRDRTGTTRMVLGIDQEDGPEIVLSGKDGKPCFVASVREGGPALTFFDDKGCRIMLGASPDDGSPCLTLRGPDGTSSFDVGFSETGQFSMALFDPEGRGRLVVGTTPTGGGPAMIFFGKDGAAMVKVGFRPDGEPILEAGTGSVADGSSPASTSSPSERIG